MDKFSLVLGGGGSKGSYQIGAWKAFRELGLEFDQVFGTSIGALNGGLIVQDSYERALSLWEEIEYQKVFANEYREDVEKIENIFDMVKYTLSDLLIEGSLDTTPFERLLREYLDEEKLRLSPVDFGLVTVEFPTGRPKMPMKNEIPIGKMADYLLASSACFPVFHPYRIDGVYYVDGGYYDNLPINMALDHGAKRVLAVDLAGIGLTKGTEETDAAVRTMRCYWELGGCFCFDRESLSRNIALGYLDGMKLFGKKEGEFFTFFSGEERENYDRLREGVPETAQRMEAMTRRPVAKTLQTLDRKSIVSFLGRGSWDREGQAMLRRTAEMAGLVFGLEPDREYRFEEFNHLLMREYRKRGRVFFKEDGAGDVVHILAALSKTVDNRNITAAIAQMLLRGWRENEAMWMLAEICPREFAAADYLRLLAKSGVE